MTSTVETSAPLIVGVGASAGGLEAFQELLLSLGDATELAIVFVQHQEKAGSDLLLELLSKSTSMSVVSVTGRKRLKPGSIYVCPPWTLLELTKGSLRIAKPENDERPEAPIDHFLQSLAESQRERGVGVILSGTGSDGTLGLKAISDAGGTTFAQSAESAKYDSMPRSAATTGVADHVLPTSAIAEELKKYASYLARLEKEIVEPSSVKQIHDAIPEISKRLMELTNHNFQHYKQNTLARRIRRRMQLLKIFSVDNYVKRLSDDDEEPQALFRELLISVTQFFRDPEAFELLASTVIPKLFAGRKPEDAVRIWVPGCATGEEAYSIAMLCREQMDQLDSPPEVQIFATDIDDRALKICREGNYPIGIADDISPERLKRFFLKRGKKYQVTQEIREIVLFSAHNLISDPPFSRLDLISCRNLLIYLGPHLQKKLIPLFHYALRPAGFLLLGPSENISSHGELFRVVDAKHRLSQRKATGVDATSALSVEEGGNNAGESNPAPIATTQSTDDLLQLMQRIVLDEFAPKSVIVDEDGKVLCASSDMDKYLTVGTGNFQNNIIKMARSGLRVGLRATLQEAKTRRRRVVHDDLSVRFDGKLQRVMLTVQPMPRVGEDVELFLVVFHDAGLPLVHGEKAHTLSGDDDSPFVRADKDADSLIVHLERELSSTRNDLEKSIQDYETANEELKSSNEELISLNEEMQSANEELETSKEEIQSAVAALERTNSDLENLLRSTQIATIFLGDDLHIRSFTPAATAIYGLIHTDIGRPLSQLMPLADRIPPLPDPTSVDGSKEITDTFQTHHGLWFVRRVLPYRSHQGERDGIVVTFTDVTELHESRKRFASLVQASAQIVWVTDAKGSVCEDSPSWREFTGQSLEQWVGEGWADALHPDYVELTFAAWKEALSTGQPLSIRYPLRHRSGDYRWTQVYAVPLRDSSGKIYSWVGMNRDVDEEVKAKIELERRERQIRLLISSTAEGIYGIDLEGNCTFANEACAKLLGYETTDELLGKQIHHLIHHSHADGSPYPVQECKIYHAYHESQRIHIDNEVFWRKDGTAFDVEYWSYPQMQDDQVVGCVVTFLDITERKKLTTKIADREAHLRRVIDNTLNFVGELDTNGILREVNATALQAGGLKREDVIGKPFWGCYWWTHDEQVVQDLKAAFATALSGEVVRYDVEIRTAGDSRLMIEFMLAPVTDENGNITHLIPSGVDISERKFAEMEVQHRVAQLDLALESGQMGIWEWDTAADHVTWSSRLYEMFGYTEETFVPTKTGFLDVVHPEDRPELERLIASAFTQTCENHECEFRVVRGDNGEVVWTHCRGNIRRADDGSPLSILSVAVDVTARKQRELSLAFLADLHGKLAALTTAEAIFNLASQSVAEFMQLSHFLMIEMDEDAVQAKVVSDYCTDQSRSLMGVYAMSDFATEEERRQLAAGQPMIVNDTTAETRLPTYAKNFAALQVGAIVNAPSSRDKKLKFMLSVTKRHPHVWREDEVDIIGQLSNTLRLKLERAHAESALRNSEERFRDLAENISQLAWMTDPTGSITWYNQRWFDYTGTTFDEMKGWGWKSVHHPDHLERVVSSWTQSLHSGEVWEDTFPLRSKDGEYRWYLTRARPIRDGNGNTLRWFGTNTDITDAKHASEQLQASQERLRLGIEVAEFALAEIDYATNTVNLSSEAARLYGLGDDATQVTRDRIHQTFHLDDRDMIQRLIDACLDDEDAGCEMAIEHRIVLPGGDVRWLSVRKRVFFDRSQQLLHPKHGILAARDITERKQWEIELADRESHLRRVINNQLGLVGVIGKDGILLEVDDRSLAIAQARREDVVGKHFADSPWWNYDPAVAQKMRSAMQLALAGEVVRYDVSLFAHGDAGVLIDFMIAPVKNEAGEVEYLIQSGVDIRERAAYEQSLKETSRRIEMALRAGRMAAWEWTPEKSIWTERVYELLGIDSSQGASIELFFSLVHPNDIESLKSEWQKAVDGADAYQAEFRIIRPDGEIRWIKGMGEVVRNQSRKVVRMYGVNWDVTLEHEQATALRLSEQRAQSANQSKSEFLANMSHEIRTPMTAILGYTDLISEKLQDTEAMEYVRTIRRNGDFLLEIINDILDLSKIEAGKFEVSQQRFSPQWLVEDVRSIMEVRATENKIKLEVEYRGSIPDQIESDPKRLRQILINLVGNAIKFTPAGTVRIVVSYSESSGHLRFDVIDSGIGISDIQLGRLFQPFSQGDGNVNREFGGTGLGLAISKRLTEMLGGEISVESELGKGSTFTVTIAASNTKHMSLVNPSSETHDHHVESNSSEIRLSCHILVVDDRRDIRFLSKRFLTAAGATVDEAEDGEVAVARVSETIERGERYDLILLDMQMPKLDGYATAKALRELGFAEPIIALTADAMQGDMKRCIESGCNDYLSKPIDKTLLLNLVNRLTS